MAEEQVNHPKHYNSHPSGIECIDIVRHMNFNLGNVIKYIWRAGIKDEEVTIQDLEKAAWYLQDEINARKKVPDHILKLKGSCDLYHPHQTCIPGVNHPFERDI